MLFIILNERHVATADDAMATDLNDEGHGGEVKGVEEGLGDGGIGDHNFIYVHVQGP